MRRSVIKNNPRWYALTKAFKEAPPEYRIGTGLTIPFIFGAYNLMEEPFENIETLVNHLREIAIDKFPVIQRCDNIHQHEVAVENKRDYNQAFDKYVNFENAETGGRLIISSNTFIGKTIEQISWSLTGEYWRYIKAEEYSWSNRRGWHKFEQGEMEIIHSVG